MDLTQGSSREAVSSGDAAALRSAGVLVTDTRRERPRYFDGRFLAARDLIRDQQYFLTREADLGRAAGSGVAVGLRLYPGADGQTLVIDAGHGITPAGELVLLPRRLMVALADIPAAEQLSARFGLSRIAQPPLRSRTGLFVLALRPVEFTANPVGAYPTSITGTRAVEDGDIIEGTAVVLVPWPDDVGGDTLDARRGQLARQIFVASQATGLSANLLPLAILALANNTLSWVDEALVRRELGADRGDLPGLGFSPRTLRLAHLLQYQEHLADVLTRSGGQTFPAAAHFPALPGVGPLPPGVINPLDFTQAFFPSEIDVDFTVIPDDELPALVEDALALPPIDLLSDSESLDSTAVVVVAPVPRHDWRAVIARLETGTGTVMRLLRPAAPNLVAQRKPFEILMRLRVPTPLQPLPSPTTPSDQEWQRLARLPDLWFVRRRHLALADDFTGVWQQVAGVDERAAELALQERVTALRLGENLDQVISRSSATAAATVTHLLAAPRVAASPALTAAFLGSLGAAARKSTGKLDQAGALKVAAAVNAPGSGDGLLRLERAAGVPLPAPALQQLAAGTDWVTLDKSARSLSTTELVRLAQASFKLQLPVPPTPGVPPPGPGPRPPAPVPPAPDPAPPPPVTGPAPVPPAPSTDPTPTTQPPPPVVQPPAPQPRPPVVSPVPVEPPIVRPPVGPVPPIVRPPIDPAPPIFRPPVAPTPPIVRPPVASPGVVLGGGVLAGGGRAVDEPAPAAPQAPVENDAGTEKEAVAPRKTAKAAPATPAAGPGAKPPARLSPARSSKANRAKKPR